MDSFFTSYNALEKFEDEITNWKGMRTYGTWMARCWCAGEDLVKLLDNFLGFKRSKRVATELKGNDNYKPKRRRRTNKIDGET